MNSKHYSLELKYGALIPSLPGFKKGMVYLFGILKKINIMTFFLHSSGKSRALSS